MEAIGWNQYGGWRIGIRSFDGRRYYYYAHMRQNYPYAAGLCEINPYLIAAILLGIVKNKLHPPVQMNHCGFRLQQELWLSEAAPWT